MAYDPVLAERIRGVLADEPDLTERAMFGGLAFLLSGTMAVAAGGEGALMVRVDPEASAELVAATSAEPMVMRGRPMAGWLVVPGDALSSAADLARWVEQGRSRARSLPVKSS